MVITKLVSVLVWGSLTCCYNVCPAVVGCSYPAVSNAGRKRKLVVYTCRYNFTLATCSKLVWKKTPTTITTKCTRKSFFLATVLYVYVIAQFDLVCKTCKSWATESGKTRQQPTETPYSISFTKEPTTKLVVGSLVSQLVDHWMAYRQWLGWELASNPSCPCRLWLLACPIRSKAQATPSVYSHHHGKVWTNCRQSATSCCFQWPSLQRSDFLEWGIMSTAPTIVVTVLNY